MWSKLDDALIDHRKIFRAGDLIGKNGPAIAIGLYAVGLMWTNKHLTDGVLPTEVVKRFRHVDSPLAVAAALVRAGLWERSNGTFRVHDFHDHNPQAAAVRETREELRKVRSAAGKLGAKAKWSGHDRRKGPAKR